MNFNRRVAFLATTVLSSTITATPAWADCLANAGGDTVVCTTADPDGYDGSAVDGLTIEIAPDTSSVAGTLSTGLNGAVNNEGDINVEGTAISVGGGSTVNNAFTATGLITGDIVFGETTAEQVNTLNNFNEAAGGITGSITSGGTLVLNNSGDIVGDIGSAGSATIVNSGTVTGNLVLDGDSNTITNSGTIDGDVAMNGLTNTFSAATGTNLPSGALTGASGADNTLNIDGTGTLSGNVSNFYTINKDGAGVWTVSGQLDADAAQTVNVNGGTLDVDDASLLDTEAGTSVFLADETTLAFNGTAEGEFTGTIADAEGASSGGVSITGANATTLSGTSTYSGDTLINGGTLITGSDTALSADSRYVFDGGGTLTVNNAVTVKSFYDTDEGTGGTIELNGAETSLTIAGSDESFWGEFGGTVVGNGNLIKSGTGSLTLDGTNAIDLSSTDTEGQFIISNGTITVTAVDAIGVDTAVQVNSGVDTTGMLIISADDTIGALSGTGTAGVVDLNEATLTTGGLGLDTTYAGTVIGSGTLVKTGEGTMTLTGFNTYTGGTSVSGGTLVGYAGTDETDGSLQGDFAVSAGAQLVFDQALSPAENGDGTYAGEMSGAGDVAFFGTDLSTLTLTGGNSGLTGTSLFGSGTVSISAADNLGVGDLEFDGGTLRNTADVTLANDVLIDSTATFQTDAETTLTLNGNISSAPAPVVTLAAITDGANPGSLFKTGTGTLVLGGVNTYTGGSNVLEGTLSGQAGTGLQGDIAVSAGALVQFTGTYDGGLSGAGDVEIASGSVTTLDGINVHTGLTTVDEEASLIVLSGALSEDSTLVNNGVLTLAGDSSAETLSGSGTVNLGNGTLTIGTIGNATFDGELDGPGSLAVIDNGGGAWTFAGTTGTPLDSFVNDAVTVIEGDLAATIGTNNGTLMGNGTFTGSLVNAGTIAPGNSPGIFTVAGDFTQTEDGTYSADINGNGTTTVVAGTDYDQIVVTGLPGTATLDGSLVVVQNGGLYVDGTEYDIITASGGISGSMAISGNVISPFITLSNATADGGGIVTVTDEDDTYRLVVVRSDYNTVATTPNQAAVADGLQGLVDDDSAAATVIQIDNMTAAQAQALFDQVSPEGYGAYATALQDQGNMFTRQVAGRLTDASLGSAKSGVWLNGYGQWANGKNKSYRFGSDHDIFGFAGGLDFKNDNFVAGVAAGYSRDKVDYNPGSLRGKSKSWQLGGYAAITADALQATAQLAYIHGNIDTTKTVQAGSGASLVSGTARASTSGHLVKGIATISYEVGSGDMSARPYVGVDFASGKVKGFTETGLGVLNLTVDDIDADRTDILAGVRLSGKMGSVSPYLNAAYRYRTNSGHTPVTALFNDNAATAFTVSAQRSGRSQVDLDLGISAAVGATASVFAGYQGTFRSDLTSHGVNAGVRFGF